MHKIEGHEDLLKDPRNNCIINTDMKSLQAAKNAKKRILDEMEKTNNLQHRLDKLELLVQQIIKDK